jgi:hypothetical protein
MAYDKATASIEFHRLIDLANGEPEQSRVLQNRWRHNGSQIGDFVTDAVVD